MVATTQQQSTTGNSHYTAVEQIASATGTPVEAVRRIYEQEIQSLSSEARITQFVGVIATRRVLMQLRRH